MAIISYVQRRRSGNYEFISDLINSSTGKFEHDLLQSLDTGGSATKQAYRIALKLAMVV